MKVHCPIKRSLHCRTHPFVLGDKHNPSTFLSILLLLILFLHPPRQDIMRRTRRCLLCPRGVWGTDPARAVKAVTACQSRYVKFETRGSRCFCHAWVKTRVSAAAGSQVHSFVLCLAEATQSINDQSINYSSHSSSFPLTAVGVCCVNMQHMSRVASVEVISGVQQCAGFN